MKTVRRGDSVRIWMGLSFVVLLFIASSSGLSRLSGSDTADNTLLPKIWTETSWEDFADGQLEDVILTDISGGELRLPGPMKKIVDDYHDNSIPRFASL